MVVYEGPGDLFNCSSQTIACTVNCVGVMGAGIARECRDRVPGLFAYYLRHFPRRIAGEMDSTLIHRLVPYRVPDGRQVLLFPTKRHWRNPSELPWIDRNLEILAESYQDLGIESIALPPLGCGHGGLDYRNQVRPLLYRYLDPLPLRVELIVR